MANHKYTQESAGSGRVAPTLDFVDEINIANELRQIVEDLATIIGQIKLGDNQYPADHTSGILATNVVKNNFAAVTYPLVTDDETIGYSKGSMWVYDGDAYICTDATEGFAIWIETTQSGGSGTFLGLSDTPADYTGQAGKFVKVNVGEDALEYGIPAGGGNVSYSGTPVINDFARFTALDTIEGRSYAEAKADLSLDNVENLKVKLDATQAPTVNNDINEGYTVGSRWFDITNDKEYVCLDNTDGAAVWIETTGSGGGASQLSDLSDVGVTTPTDKNALMADGDSWESRAIVEADISDLGTYIESIVEDTTPQSGGEHDFQAHSAGFTLQEATGDGATTIDWKLGLKFEFTFGAFNEVFTFTAPSKSCNLLLVLIQDGTGSRTVTWPATVKWPAGIAPTLTTDANGIDIVTFFWNGTNYHGASLLAYAVPA